MPQLMPLNWMFSSIILLLVVMSASMLYSELTENLILNKSSMETKKMISEWFW